MKLDLFEHSKRISDVIRELQEVLDTHGDVYVVMSKDGEGNDFSPYADLCHGEYDPETTWWGEWTSHYYFDEPGWSGEVEEHAVNAVCLWPTN